MLTFSPQRAIAKFRESTLAQNTAWMSGGQGLRLLLQAVFFIIIARSLGPKEYGAFVGVVALVAVLSPFSGLGYGNVLIKNVARDPEAFAIWWGNALFMLTISGPTFALIIVCVSRIFLPPSLGGAVLFVAISDLVLARIVDLAGQAFQAREMLAYTAKLNVFFSGSRLVAALVLLVIPGRHGAITWAALYMGSAAAVALLAVVTVLRSFESPVLSLRKARTEFLEGIFFSITLSSQSIYNDIDKTMLTKFATLGDAGIYGVAYRLIDIAFVPVKSLLAAAFPTFFKHGAKGIVSAAHFGWGLVKKSAVYGLVASAGIAIVAPMLPRILGRAYNSSVEALWWLSPLVLLKSIHYFGADTLTGSGHQGLRSLVQAGVAAFNILLNLWVIPAYGWRGAAWSSLASDFLLLCCVWSCVGFLVRRESKGRTKSRFVLSPIEAIAVNEQNN